MVTTESILTIKLSVLSFNGPTCFPNLSAKLLCNSDCPKVGPLQILAETRNRLADAGIMVNLCPIRATRPIHVETRTKVTVSGIRKLLNSPADGFRRFPALAGDRDPKDFGKSDFYVRYGSARSRNSRPPRRGSFGRGRDGRVAREIA